MTEPQTLRNFDLIAFDWDGTLFDSTAVIARSIKAAVADVGGVVPGDLQVARVIGMALMPALALAAPDVPREQYPLLALRYRHWYGLYQNDLNLFPGVLPLLHALRARGYVLAVATGKNRIGLDQVLRSTELQGLFHGSRTVDETAGKPDPTMLYELMAEFGVPPQRLLMVGDTSHDLQMAVNAGCASVAVSYGARDTGGFAALGPLFVAPSVAELQDWLLAHG